MLLAIRLLQNDINLIEGKRKIAKKLESQLPRAYKKMNVLKIATAGSVDDGKSTLIGRLLYDTKSLTDDKLAAIEEKSKQRGFDYLDFSLATDGLVAEREQGITIDVAHIYFSEEKYNSIKREIEYLASKSEYKNQQLTFIPMSALQGDNVASKSDNMSWYAGETLLHHLEKLDTEATEEVTQVRFPIQTVIRPKTENYHDFRGYAGKIYGGDLAIGDEVAVLPSQTKSRIKSIHFFDKEYTRAKRGSSVTITLEDNVNVSRGDMLVKVAEEPTITKQLDATICWMDKEPLQVSQKYYIKHGVNDAQAKITQLSSILKTDFSGKIENPSELALNQIGVIQLKLSKYLLVDSYHQNKSNGAFILINPKTNNTVGVGFIQ